MALQEIIGFAVIRFFVHPLRREQPVDFKTHLKKATRVLISCPNGRDIEHLRPIVAKFAALFPREGLIVLCPGTKKYSPQKHRIQKIVGCPIAFPDVLKQSLWNIMRSKTLNQLRQQSFDVFLDLDPDFNLLNAYLCRLLHPPVRISFTKLHSNVLYNLQYNGKTKASRTERLEGFFRFLQTLFS